VLSDEEQSELNKAFGYPHEPTDVNCVNKFTPPDNFSAAVWWTWQGVWEDAQKAGVSRPVFEAAFADITPSPSILAHTKQQAEFIKPLWAKRCAFNVFF
jgi:membrane-bound lytic murein transglycosylase B